MSQPLKIGLIGAGRISGKHIAAAHQFPQQIRFTAVCDPNEQAARARAAEVNTDRIYSDYSQLIREADIDAVSICSVSCYHAEQAVAAAEAGKHVLLEKPMATSMQQCRDIVRACDKAGVVCMIAHNQRYKANYRAVRRVIQSGEIGAVQAVRVESLSHTISEPGHWALDGARGGGGVVISLAIHRIDLARFFAGNIKRVSGLVKTTRPQFINGAEDWAWARYEFDNGAIGELFATWSGFRLPWGESFIVFGQTGTVHALPLLVKYSEPALIASAQRTPEQPTRDDKRWKTRGFVPLPIDEEGLPTGDMYVDEVLHFVECCRTGKEPISSARDNTNTMAGVFGLYESSRRGGAPVDVSEL